MRPWGNSQLFYVISCYVGRSIKIKTTILPRNMLNWFMLAILKCSSVTCLSIVMCSEWPLRRNQESKAMPLSSANNVIVKSKGVYNLTFSDGLLSRKNRAGTKNSSPLISLTAKTQKSKRFFFLCLQLQWITFSKNSARGFLKCPIPNHQHTVVSAGEA